MNLIDWTFDFRSDNPESFSDYLDPKQLHFIKHGDALMLTIDNDRSYLKIHAVRAFPMTDLNDFIGLLDAINGRDIGLIKSLQDLDCEPRHLVQEQINKRYFIPKIARILQAKREFGTVYWDVETDRGRRMFTMRGIRDSVHEVEPGRYLILDVDGNRFEIPQLPGLDHHSQIQWDKLI